MGESEEKGLERWAPRETVTAALSGDEIAVELLVAAVWPACFRLAVTVIGDRNLAQDAAQEACVVVYRKVRTLRRAEAFDAWLYRIVMRESNRVRRRGGGTGLLGLASPPVDTTGMDVWRALAELPPQFRDVTVLFYFDDLKSEEIAAILRLSHATVRTRLARARDRLRVLLSDYAETSSSGQKKVNESVL